MSEETQVSVEERVSAEAQVSMEKQDYMEKARELADSYPQLLAKRQELKQQIEESSAWFYTREEVIYKLSQLRTVRSTGLDVPLVLIRSPCSCAPCDSL